MTDVLVRNVPEEVIAALDARASRWVYLAANTFVDGWPRRPKPVPNQ